MLTALVFFNQIHPVRLTLTGLRVAFLITWVRITFCRFRYDFLMNLAWKQLLPILLFLLLIVLIFV
jgi:NADH:ubiquinone oxidoreductase subunit H